VELGDSLTDFMRQLEMVPTGGRWGSIRRLREQMIRLFSSSIDLHTKDEESFRSVGMRVASQVNLWWKPVQPQTDLWTSWVELGEKFYEELRDHSLPIDMRCVKSLRKSPLALDIYTWLTYRFSYLRRPTEVPWEALALQFGSEYQDMRHFRESFKEALARVLMVYQRARIGEGNYGLQLLPSRTSVRALPPQLKIASEDQLGRWIKRYPGWARRLQKEIDLILRMRVGSHDPLDPRILAEQAADRSKAPLAIAYRLCGVTH